MNLYSKLKQDIIDYRKGRDPQRTKILQTMVGEFNTAEKSKVVIDDAYVIKNIKICIATNNNNIPLLSDQARIDALVFENEFLSTYLPQVLSEDEVKQIIADNGLTDVPTGMKYFKEHYNGRYDGKMVSSILKG